MFTESTFLCCFQDSCLEFCSTCLYSLFSCSVMLWPCGLQHARLPCPLPFPRVCSNSYPLGQWCHPTISSSVILLSSFLQSLPASGYFPVSQLFVSCSQSIGASVSASVLPMNIKDWFPLGLTELISLQSKGLSRAFSNTTVWKNHFFSTQPSLWSNLVHTSFSVLSKPNSAYAYLKLFFFFHSQTQLLVLPSTQALTFFHIHYKPLRFKDSVCAYARSIMFYSLWPHGL